MLVKQKAFSIKKVSEIRIFIKNTLYKNIQEKGQECAKEHAIIKIFKLKFIFLENFPIIELYNL